MIVESGRVYEYDTQSWKQTGVQNVVIDDIVGGMEHTFLITRKFTAFINMVADKDFYFYEGSDNNYSQAASTGNVPANYKMRGMEKFQNQIVYASSGGWHCLALLKSNQVISWGYNLGASRTLKLTNRWPMWIYNR